MDDNEEKDDVLIETDPEDSDFVEEHGDPITLLFRKCFAVRRYLTPCRDIKSSIRGVRLRIMFVILSLTMKTARTSSLEHL